MVETAQSGRRAVLGDCNPGIVLLDKVADRPEPGELVGHLDAVRFQRVLTLPDGTDPVRCQTPPSCCGSYLLINPVPLEDFVRPVLTMDQRAWTECHVAAFEFFGGVPARLVPDNLKTGVDKPDPYDPKINRSYAEHYGTLVDPARAAKPKDKPRVERPMPYVRDSYWRGREFVSLQHMQEQAVLWCKDVAGRRQCRPLGGAAPLSVLDAVEAFELMPLPRKSFVLVTWSTGTIGPDIHVRVGKSLYSVPWAASRPPGGPAPTPRCCRRCSRRAPGRSALCPTDWHSRVFHGSRVLVGLAALTGPGLAASAGDPAVGVVNWTDAKPRARRRSWRGLRRTTTGGLAAAGPRSRRCLAWMRCCRCSWSARGQSRPRAR